MQAGRTGSWRRWTLRVARGAFTGAESVAHAGALEVPGVVVAGNMLAGPEVIEAALDGFRAAAAMPFPERLMGALGAAAAAGGDARGLLSAALLVVGRDMAPLTLRIDHFGQPVGGLGGSLSRVAGGPLSWLDGRRSGAGRSVACPCVGGGCRRCRSRIVEAEPAIRR